MSNNWEEQFYPLGTSMYPPVPSHNFNYEQPPVDAFNFNSFATATTSSVPMSMAPSSGTSGTKRQWSTSDPSYHMAGTSTSASTLAQIHQPQPPMSAYDFFVENYKAELSLIHHGADVVDVSIQCSQIWTVLGEENKSLFEAMAREDEERYKLELTKYNPQPLSFLPTPVAMPGSISKQMSMRMPTSISNQMSMRMPTPISVQKSMPTQMSMPMTSANVEKKRKTTTRKKDKSAPKGPISAFFFYCSEQRPIVKAENSGMKLGDVSKELGRRWSLVNAYDRQKYQAMADNDKLRYSKEMESYNNQQSNLDNVGTTNTHHPQDSSNSGWNNYYSDFNTLSNVYESTNVFPGLNSEILKNSSVSMMLPCETPENKSTEPLISPYDIAFAKFQFLTSTPASHKFYPSSFKANNEHEFLQAYQREIKILEELPNGIFVAGFEDRMDLFSALIIGPEGTPYEGGLFAFDIMLPPNYPHAPPIFHYISYAHDRLNPNLYVQGKVCVSILGTWAGTATEVWSAQHSSLLQVLVSIQGLILVSEPYFNEPGFETTRGTPTGIQRSKRYNEKTIQLMLESVAGMLARPSPPWEFEVTYVLKNEIPRMIKRVESWIKKDKDVSLPKFPLLPIEHPTLFYRHLENLKRAHATYVKM